MHAPKVSFLVVLVLALTLALAACSGGTAAPTTAPAAAPAPATSAPAQPAAPAGPSGTITFYNFTSTPDHVKDLEAIVKAFNAQYPNVTVKVETTAYADYFTKLQALIAGGTAPDVFELNYENFVTYAAKGTLYDLTSMIGADKSFDPKVFYPRAYQAFNLNGKQYGMSESFSDVVMFYNKDLFTKAGVDLPTDDWTWDQALAAAHKLTDVKAGQWGLYKPTQFFEFYKTAYQFGCDFFNADKTAVQINDPKCVDALTFMVNLSTKDHVMPTDAELGGTTDFDTAAFKSGKLAMWVNGIWQFATLKDVPFNWDIVVEPGAVRKGAHFFSNAVVVSKDTKNAEAAYAWLKFLTTSSDEAKIRVSTSWELPALSDKALVSDYLALKPPANRQAVFKSLDYIVTTPVIEKQAEMQAAIEKQLAKAKLGQITPKDALDAAKKDVDALLAAK